MAGLDNDIDQIVDLITERVRGRLGRSLPVVQAADKGDCGAGENEDCSSCGACVVRRPWSVRAIEAAGASRVGAPSGIGKLDGDFAKLIDHTLLKPEAQREDIVRLCEEARKYHFASVCVNSTWVGLAKALLANSGVMVCAVVGFPLGAMSPGAKAYEARDAVRHGANEIDMVMNIGAMKSRDYETVFEDICRVVKASKPAGVKVILECSSLTDEEKVIGCSLSKLAGAAFVKTSTGFAKGGATVEDVTLMRRVVGSELGVKASGGVRSAEDAARMTEAGANRIGASASIAIATGKQSGKSSGY
jgi:deoxyribose-phosphate aldolase